MNKDVAIFIDTNIAQTFIGKYVYFSKLYSLMVLYLESIVLFEYLKLIESFNISSKTGHFSSSKLNGQYI